MYKIWIVANKKGKIVAFMHSYSKMLHKRSKLISAEWDFSFGTEEVFLQEVYIEKFDLQILHDSDESLVVTLLGLSHQTFVGSVNEVV